DPGERGRHLGAADVRAERAPVRHDVVADRRVERLLRVADRAGRGDQQPVTLYGHAGEAVVAQVAGHRTDLGGGRRVGRLPLRGSKKLMEGGAAGWYMARSAACSAAALRGL